MSDSPDRLGSSTGDPVPADACARTRTRIPGGPLRIYCLKRTTIPKLAVLATGLTAAILVATINPMPAQAFPSKAANCAGCHAVGGSTTAAASTLTPAAGSTYTVAITMAANPAGGNTGYAIVPVAPAVEKTNGGNTGSQLSFTATMVAPSAAGTYKYNVYTNQGVTDPSGYASGTSYSITIASVVTIPPTTIPPTTIPPTTIPPTTIPPTTVPPTTVPPTTVPATTIPPTTIPPTTIPPTTIPPTTVPPTTIPPTTIPPTTIPPTTIPPTTIPPVSTTSISSLSPDHGTVGTWVTIRGTNFGTPGVVKFGEGTARVFYWSSSSIVVTVPSTYIVEVGSDDASSPVWYRNDGTVPVTVTPSGAAASNAVGFRMESSGDDGDDD